MDGEVLPENLILEVLSRLPVKTITRYKCVCKKWRDLVSDAYFIDLHLSRSRPCLMFHLYLSRFRPILELVDVEHEVDYHRLTLNHVKSLDLHLSAFCGGNWIIQVGSVNGLVCLCHMGGATYIFNPVVEEYMILPRSTMPHTNLWLISYDFGVSMTGEYKVIRIWGRSPSNVLDAEVTIEIEVYTLSTDQWRSLGPTPYFIRYPGELNSGLFLNSHVYWIIFGQIYDFDLDTETFELFPTPPGPGANPESEQMLGVLKGSLSRFSWCSLGLEVWVMKDKSWSKMIAIQENIDPVFSSPKWKPLFLIDGSEGTSILILCVKFDTKRFDTSKLVAYCLNTNKILDLNLPGNFWTVWHTYTPSFVKLRNFGSERVHSLYSTDTVSVKNRYRSSLKFEQR